MADSDFGRVSYTEAVELLKKNNDKFDYKVEWGCDLQTEHERYLTEQVFKKPVFVTDYPKEIKAFYMRLNDDGKTVAAADCLVPGIGEIIGGSQREERLDVLEAPHGRSWGMNPKDYWWYLDLRRYGACQPRRLRPGLRADGHVPHRHLQHPGRGAPPQNRGQRGFLNSCRVCPVRLCPAAPHQPHGRWGIRECVQGFARQGFARGRIHPVQGR